MAGDIRRKQRLIYAGLALCVTLALAVTLATRPKDGPDKRMTEVISDFIILSAAPDPRGVDFLSRDRVQRANRQARLTHVQPQVIAHYAAALGLEEEALRQQISDPNQTGPFDHTGLIFDSPDTFATGTAAPWHWARVTERAERAEIRASQTGEVATCGSDRPCRVWLVYWDAAEWYYAPVGEAALDAAVEEAVPALAPALKSDPAAGYEK